MLALVYTIAYGSPEVKDPNENRKVLFGVAALMLGSVGLFAFLRSFGTYNNIFWRASPYVYSHM